MWEIDWERDGNIKSIENEMSHLPPSFHKGKLILLPMGDFSSNKSFIYNFTNDEFHSNQSENWTWVSCCSNVLVTINWYWFEFLRFLYLFKINFDINCQRSITLNFLGPILMRVQSSRSNEIEQSCWLGAINWTYCFYIRLQDQKATTHKNKFHYSMMCINTS